MSVYALEYYNVDGNLELLFFDKSGVIDKKSDISTTQPEEPGTFTVFILKPSIQDMEELSSESSVIYEGIGQISDHEKLDLGYEMAEELIGSDLDLLYQMCEAWPSVKGDKLFEDLLEAINTRVEDDDDDEG